MKRLSRLLVLPFVGMLAGMLVLSYARPTSATTSVPSFSHIFEIVMENHSYGSIIGNSSAPYINSLAQQ